MSIISKWAKSSGSICTCGNGICIIDGFYYVGYAVRFLKGLNIRWQYGISKNNVKNFCWFFATLVLYSIAPLWPLYGIIGVPVILPRLIFKDKKKCLTTTSTLLLLVIFLPELLILIGFLIFPIVMGYYISKELVK